MANSQLLSIEGDVVNKPSSEMSVDCVGVSKDVEREKCSLDETGATCSRSDRQCFAREQLHALALSAMDLLDDDPCEADVNSALERMQAEETEPTELARIAGGIWQLVSGSLVFVDASADDSLESSVDELAIAEAYGSWFALKQRLKVKIGVVQTSDLAS